MCSPNDILSLQAREESADLEKDVCRSTSSSLHLVPVPSKVSGRWQVPGGRWQVAGGRCLIPLQMETALHTCARLSGQVARYSSKQKFESIVGFLSSRYNSLDFASSKILNLLSGNTRR